MQPHFVILSPVGTSRHHVNERSILALSAVEHVSLVTVHGISEVARARNQCATKALPVVEHLLKDENLDVFVLWLDADMEFQVDTIRQHMEAVRASCQSNDLGLAVSGRYVSRKQPSRLAAAIDEDETRPMLVSESLSYRPIRAGMGALMMTGKLFHLHVTTRPSNVRFNKSGQQAIEYLVCCPRIIEIKGQMEMLSEDFDYCETLPGGVWYCEGEGVSIDYGHVCEYVAYPTPGITKEVDDR